MLVLSQRNWKFSYQVLCRQLPLWQNLRRNASLWSPSRTTQNASSSSLLAGLVLINPPVGINRPLTILSRIRFVYWILNIRDTRLFTTPPFPTLPSFMPLAQFSNTTSMFSRLFCNAIRRAAAKHPTASSSAGARRSLAQEASLIAKPQPIYLDLQVSGLQSQVVFAWTSSSPGNNTSWPTCTGCDASIHDRSIWQSS